MFEEYGGVTLLHFHFVRLKSSHTLPMGPIRNNFTTTHLAHKFCIWKLWRNCFRRLFVASVFRLELYQSSYSDQRLRRLFPPKFQLTIAEVRCYGASRSALTLLYSTNIWDWHWLWRRNPHYWPQTRSRYIYKSPDEPWDMWDTSLPHSAPISNAWRTAEIYILPWWEPISTRNAFAILVPSPH